MMGSVQLVEAVNFLENNFLCFFWSLFVYLLKWRV